MVLRGIGLKKLIDLFEYLAQTGITFTCTFEKLDETSRTINARMIGPVQWNSKKRESYANVVDLDLPVGGNNDRKIVLQRVLVLTTACATYTI